MTMSIIIKYLDRFTQWWIKRRLRTDKFYKGHYQAEIFMLVHGEVIAQIRRQGGTVDAQEDGMIRHSAMEISLALINHVNKQP